jgi:hypothetical protein
LKAQLPHGSLQRRNCGKDWAKENRYKRRGSFEP